MWLAEKQSRTLQGLGLREVLRETLQKPRKREKMSWGESLFFQGPEVAGPHFCNWKGNPDGTFHGPLVTTEGLINTFAASFTTASHPERESTWVYMHIWHDEEIWREVGSNQLTDYSWEMTVDECLEKARTKAGSLAHEISQLPCSIENQWKHVQGMGYGIKIKSIITTSCYKDSNSY